MRAPAVHKLYLSLLLMLVSSVCAAQQIAFDDNLRNGQSVKNIIRIVGWALTPNSLGRVDIYMGDQFLGEAAYPLPRTDVPNSGFVLEVDTTRFANATYPLQAVSYSPQGERLASAVLDLAIKNTPSVGYIEIPGFRDPVAGEAFGAGGWALGNDGFAELSLLLNGIYESQADYRVQMRQDVYAAFPEYGVPDPQFAAPVSTDGLSRGFHVLELYGKTPDGTLRKIADTEFFFTGGNEAFGYIDHPAQNSVVDVMEPLQVSGWVSAAEPIVGVRVYLNHRLVAETRRFTSRGDVAAAFPQAENVAAFSLSIPSIHFVPGRQLLMVEAEDASGNRALVDTFTGPIRFTVERTDRLLGAHLRPDNSYHEAIALNRAAMGGVAPDIVMYFLPWQIDGQFVEAFDEYPFLPGKIVASGAVPMITWESWAAGDAFSSRRFPLADIAAGKFDAYISSFARRVRDFEEMVLIRFNHEFNGDANPWTGVVNGNDPDAYIDAWRHVVDVFRFEGAHNAKFVWAPNYTAPPEVELPSSDFNNYYPGDGYVDFIGVSGYNWGNDPLRGGGWQTVAQLFDNFMALIEKYYPTKPVIISEIGSVPGYAHFSREQWVRDAFAHFENYPNLKGVVWFNDYAFARSDLPDFRVTDTLHQPPVDPGLNQAYREAALEWSNGTNALP